MQYQCWYRSFPRAVCCQVGHDWLRSVISQGKIWILNANPSPMQCLLGSLVGHDWLCSVMSQGGFEILSLLSVLTDNPSQSNVLIQQPSVAWQALLCHQQRVRFESYMQCQCWHRSFPRALCLLSSHMEATGCAFFIRQDHVGSLNGLSGCCSSCRMSW